MREPVSPADYEALQAAGARITRRYQRLPMASITVAGTALPRLAVLPAVTRISPDLQVKRTMEFASPAVGADVARTQYGYTGKGVGVAVIDSGIYYSKDLGTFSSGSPGPYRVACGYDFILNTVTTVSNDLCGHG